MSQSLSSVQRSFIIQLLLEQCVYWTYTRELPHLRPRTEVILAVLRLRDKATRAFNGFFEVGSHLLSASFSSYLYMGVL
jgi:aspartyl/asparaginyl-tRNA synthetase